MAPCAVSCHSPHGGSTMAHAPLRLCVPYERCNVSAAPVALLAYQCSTSGIAGVSVQHQWHCWRISAAPVALLAYEYTAQFIA
jgi:hypothetical protein